jgi:hypothetical protein
MDELDEKTRQELYSSNFEINHVMGVPISVSNDLEQGQVCEMGRSKIETPNSFELVNDIQLSKDGDLWVESMNYTFPADENFTEEVTLVGHVKESNIDHDDFDEKDICKNAVSNAIDWQLKYCKDARLDLLARASDILTRGITKNARV